MSVEITVICNGCSTVGGGSSESAKVVRDQLRDAGWLVNRPGGEDLCEECKPRKVATAPNPGGAK